MIRVADILAGSMDKYLLNHKLSYKQRKVANKIINCFSDSSPEILFKCSNNDCSYIEHKKKPCRDRHCNRCNNNKKIKWVIKLMKNFPAMPYYHIVFTLPAELNNLFICNQKRMYDMFFRASFYVLNTFASDTKYYGGKIGYVGLLHTWGQKLNYHPHLHFIVLAGGIKNGRYKPLPYYKDFIFPVKAMSKVMMGKFIDMLNYEYQRGKLNFPGKLESIRAKQDFGNYLYDLSKKEFIVYSKKPIPQTEKVLEYISRYTHKIAISNNRIKSYENGRVIFEYRDYRDNDKFGVPKKKTTDMSDMEFIKRYLRHILPHGFRKIRYGGIFSSNQRKHALKIIKDNLKELSTEIINKTEKILKQLEELVRNECPVCYSKLIPVEIIPSSGYV